MKVIDFHTHAFPDSLAERAVPQLEEEGDIKAFLDGKVVSLLESMDRAGIEKSVVCSIATKPEQFGAIIRWSKDIASRRIEPLPSVHPGDPDSSEAVRIVYEEGFKGIKLHPYYQAFDLDSEAVFPVYEKLCEYGLFCVSHTGFDIAFPRVRKADPAKVAKVLERFPELTFVTTHLGGWEDWGEVRKHLLGRPVYMEISFSFGYLPDEELKEMIASHPSEYLLFGTDSPWKDQKNSLKEVLGLNLDPGDQARLLYSNAQRLLSQAGKASGN